MGTEFTKGPWWPALGSGRNMLTAIFGGTEDAPIMVADLLPDWALDPQYRAPEDHRPNLNLISAAPDLYAVVEAAVEQWGSLDPSSLRLWEANLLVVARAALGKARGES